MLTIFIPTVLILNFVVEIFVILAKKLIFKCIEFHGNQLNLNLQLLVSSALKIYSLLHASPEEGSYMRVLIELATLFLLPYVFILACFPGTV